jgi:hypothetical protein
MKISEELRKLFSQQNKINHILLRSEKHSFHFHLTFTKHISTPLKLSKQNRVKKIFSYVTHSFIATNLQKCEYFPFLVLLGNNTVPAQHSISHILFNLILVEPQYFLF